MARLLSILLIPFFVLGPALPHSHAGSGVVTPDGHELHPHVHLHGHDHHAHVKSNDHHVDGEASGDGVLDSSDEHDSDAIYLGSLESSLSRSVGNRRADLGGAQWVSTCVLYRTGLGSAFRIDDPPDHCRTLPIYLLTRCLRL